MTIKAQTDDPGERMNIDMEVIARHSADDALAAGLALELLSQVTPTEQLFLARENAHALGEEGAAGLLDELIDKRLGVALDLTESELEVLFQAINSVPVTRFGPQDPKDPRVTVQRKIETLRLEVHDARS